MVQLNKIHGSGTTTVKFSNEEVDVMVKIIKALEYSGILMKETLENDVKKGGALPILPMLLGTLGASLLSGRGFHSKCNCGKEMYRAGEGLFRAGQGIKKNINSAGTTSFNKL